MWWNYRKPKPLKDGAFKLAARNNAPVIPIFITMEDSDIIGEDGFPVQEYIINIEEPIYYEDVIKAIDDFEKKGQERVNKKPSVDCCFIINYSISSIRYHSMSFSFSP